MERPTPTKQLIIEECGGNHGLIESLHHGLNETFLQEFYPILDFDETVAFAASSWKSRAKDIATFRSNIWSADTYDLFNQVYSIGFPWLNKYKAISPDLSTKHKLLNPFNGRDLKDRLENIPIGSVQKLRKELMNEPREYVFECQYYDRKALRGGDNHGLEIMRFQNVYPKSGKIVPAFASEIARIFKSYPTAVYSP